MSYSFLNSLEELNGTTCIYSSETYDEYGGLEKEVEIECVVHMFDYKIEDTLLHV